MEFRIDKKVVIDAYRGGDDIGSSANGIVEKDYNLEIGKYIYDRLRALGVPVSITRDSDETLDMGNRVNRIKSFYGNGNDVIVISNALNSSGTGAEVVYGLRNSNALASRVANELEKVGVDEIKFYQRRLPSDTAKDYNQLIRDTANNESLVIYYGNIGSSNEAGFLNSNLETLGEAVVIALADYLNINYVPVSGSNYYIVKKGDSLYSIANKYDTTVSELKELNNLSTNNLSINQVLKIPTKEVNSDTDGQEFYVVKSGDTLYSIARKFGLTVNELKSLNNLTNNTLKIGQRLKVSEGVVDGDNYVTYKVVSGDSLYGIASKYNITVDEIKRFNNLTSNILSIGQVLKIPSTSSNSATYLTYKVVSGDSLYSIARKYNTTVDELKRLNNLTSNMLSIGQILKIANKSDESGYYLIYKVVSGDSLYSIAKRFNTNVNAIKILNNLNSNLLRIGQILKIPS